ncbi:MFS transporter [Streptomyces sp. TRM72054]|uniref:MFS transporter n=1 Tax=Streptomyces sp. TRM72054 TaxID=2870562 RepID=UPI0027DF9D03|nr:MFS transporter [Streptomyces sp. TRM72054]
MTAFCARMAEEGMAVAVVMLAAHRLDSAAQGAFILAAWMARHVLAAPLTGASAARAQRPRLFYACALTGFAGAIAALSVSIGRLPMPAVLVIAAAGGCCGPVVSGGLSSLLALMLRPGPEQDRAYALDSSVYSAAAVAGPAVAGLTATAVGPGAAVAVLAVAAASAAALACVLPLCTGPAGEPDPSPVRSDLVAGLAAMWRSRELRAITTATCMAFAGIGALTTTAVLLADSQGRPGTGGWLMTAFAAGALTGSLALARLRPAASPVRLAVTGMAGTGLALAAAALASGPLTCAAAFAAAGVCDGLLLTATLRLRAGHAPPHQRTQVFTIGAGLKISASALGAALVGLAGSASATWDLAAIAALQLVAAVVYACMRRQPGPRKETPSRYPSLSSSSSAVSGSPNGRKPPPAGKEAVKL